MDSSPNFITYSALLSTPLDTIVTTDTLAVNNLSVNNKYYLYLQTHESSRMQLSSRSLSRQIRNRINCSNLLLTSECIFRKSLLAAKKHPLQKLTCSKLFYLHLLHRRKPYNWMNAKSLSNFIAFILNKSNNNHNNNQTKQKITRFKRMNRGYYMVARSYECYFRKPKQYCFCHEKIKFISLSRRVYYVDKKRSIR